MKKVLIVIVIVLCSVSLYSAESLVKFYLQDGSSKQYSLSDIENMKFSSAPDILQFHIFKNNGKNLYYPAQLIDSIKFAIDTTNENRMHLWHDGFIWDVAIHEIDSILLYYTTYTAVTIGDQHWMYKNLNVDHFRNGDTIPEVKSATEWSNLSTGAWCYYNNDTAIGKIYGKLYNWYTTRDIRELAPIGFHISSYDEWLILIKYLGDNHIAGGKLKSIGSIEFGSGLWYNPNQDATNESGFSALPSGYRSQNGSFLNKNINGFWWTTKQSYYSDKMNMVLYFDSATIGWENTDKRYAFSVRCVKD